MYKKNSARNRLVLMLSIGGMALSACSTQGASRYNDTQLGAGSAQCGGVAAPSACSVQQASRYGSAQFGSGQVPCGAVIQPCGQQQQPLQMIEYHAVTVTPPSYIVPAPCPTGQCEPVIEPPVVVAPPVVEAPVIIEPPVVSAPVVLPPPPPPLRTSCPEGTIPGYGGQGCIPITIPRK